MATDPIGIIQQIYKIKDHPLWECYVLPSALGMLAKEVCGDEDPLANFERYSSSYFRQVINLL